MVGAAEGKRYEAKVESKLIDDGLKLCTYTLNIAECNPKDVGNYSLRVKNEYNEASCNVRKQYKKGYAKIYETNNLL